MPTYLQPNEVVAAVTEPAVVRVLEPFVKAVHGRENVFTKGGCGMSASLDIGYEVQDVKVELNSPHIQFNEFDLDTTLYFRLKINFSELYDCVRRIIGILPPRCIKVCIPFTNKCWQKCISLGQIGFNVSIPLSFDLTGLYIPDVTKVTHDGEEFHRVYPKISYITPLILDVPETIRRICRAIADVLPWPLDRIAGKLIEFFGRLFDWFEDALNWLAVNLTKLLFDVTGGWISLPLRFVKLFEFPVARLPGPTDDPENPPIPVAIPEFKAIINSADELDVRLKLLPA